MAHCEGISDQKGVKKSSGGSAMMKFKNDQGHVVHVMEYPNGLTIETLDGFAHIDKRNDGKLYAVILGSHIKVYTRDMFFARHTRVEEPTKKPEDSVYQFRSGDIFEQDGHLHQCYRDVDGALRVYCACCGVVWTWSAGYYHPQPRLIGSGGLSRSQEIYFGLSPEGRTALEGSVKKWLSIVKGQCSDQGHTDCPLCKLYWQLYQEGAPSGSCFGCPIQEFTGRNICVHTPYQAFVEANRRSPTDGVSNEDAYHAALEFLTWLAAFLPDIHLLRERAERQPVTLAESNRRKSDKTAMWKKLYGG